MRLAGQHDDVAALTIAVEVQRHVRVALDMAQLGRVRLAVHQHGAAIPQKPDRAGLGCAVMRHRRQPDEAVVLQPLQRASTKIGGGVDEHGHMVDWCTQRKAKTETSSRRRG